MVKVSATKLKRRYEVDESNWLVIKGRAFLKLLDTDGRACLGILESTNRTFFSWINKESIGTRRWFVVRWPGIAADARFSMRRFTLTLRWRRVPMVWEMLFIDRMKAAERISIPFIDVLRETLPKVIGIDGTRVLGYWTGRSSFVDPETFVRQTFRFFGRGSKTILMGVFDNLDERKMLVKMTPEEPNYQTLVNAINEADQKRDRALVGEEGEGGAR